MALWSSYVLWPRAEVCAEKSVERIGTGMLVRCRKKQRGQIARSRLLVEVGMVLLREDGLE
jgi:hypothetical protein